jgi:hypothetical protein
MPKLKQKAKPTVVVADPELADLVKRAQQGDVSARNKLYERFEFFLMKYRTFFHSESDMIRLAKTYPDIASFVALFMSKKMYHAIKSRKWSPDLTDRIIKKTNEIKELANEIGGQEDIDLLIDLTFFELVQKYDTKGKVRKELRKKGLNYDMMMKSEKRKWDKEFPEVGFEGYLVNVFKWRLFKNIEAETKGLIPGVGWCKPYAVGGYDNETMNDEDMMNLAEFESVDESEMIEAITDNININHEWIMGDECGDPFSQLSQQERWILKMRFVEHKGLRQIAESVGMSPSVIRGKYNDIIQKIADGLGPDWFETTYNDKDDKDRLLLLLGKFFDEE